MLVGKTPLILAPVVVGAALLFLAFLMGRWFERAGQRYASSFISSKTHTALIELVRRILTSVDVDQACFLPDAVKTQAEKVLAAADEQAAARRRLELRRNYG